ncbi:MAG: hypothetical protein ACI4S2_05765 [Lachnospiraceae bacterium]
MEDNKTIFNYLGQLFATYGIIVTIFVVFTLLIGENVNGVSSLYSLGNKGLSIQTLIQVFILSIIITISQVAFLTDKWIKNMQMIIRNIMFFGTICVTVALFSWFPMGNVGAWIGFLISFIVCSAISVGIKKLAEDAENKKLAQALKKLKEK